MDIPRTSGGHSRGYPGPNFGQGGQNPGKNRHLGADIHDPKARTSMTLRDFQNFGQRNFGLNFRSLTAQVEQKMLTPGQTQTANLPRAASSHCTLQTCHGQ